MFVTKNENSMTLFTGDSIVEGFNTEKLLHGFNIINKGVSGSTTKDLLLRIDGDIVSKPSKIFILIGTNDIAQCKNDELIPNIKKIILKIKAKLPESYLEFNSILPTRDNYPRPNKIIDDINYSLKETVKNSGADFFDLNVLMKDDSGKLKAEFTDDGLHLTDEAYKLWAKIFRERFSDQDLL